MKKEPETLDEFKAELKRLCHRYTAKLGSPQNEEEVIEHNTAYDIFADIYQTFGICADGYLDHFEHLEAPKSDYRGISAEESARDFYEKKYRGR